MNESLANGASLPARITTFIQPAQWHSRFLRILVIGAACGFIAIYLVVAAFRLAYPFELEWVEGGVVDHVTRVLSGQPLYVKPSIEFTPFIYTPLYYYIAAVVAKLFGNGFLPLRLVSFLASLGCFAVIYKFVQRETGGRVAGFIAVGVFAATYSLTGTWFDVGRVDMLALFFVLTAFYVVRFYPSTKGFILAGVLASLSFFTKQSGLVAFAPILVYCFWVNRRAALALTLTLVALIGGSTVIFDFISGGWYSFYILKLPRQHAIERQYIVGFWKSDLLPLYIAGATSLLCFFVWWVRGKREQCLYYLMMAAGMVGSAWSARIHSGGYVNVLLPAYAAIIILFGVSLQMTLSYAHTFEIKKRVALQSYIYLICLIQFAVLVYNPVRSIPTSAAVREGEGLVAALARFEGEVYSPYHGHVTTMAGKPTSAHLGALLDVVRSDETQVISDLRDDMTRAFAAHKYTAVIMDANRSGWYADCGKDGWAECTDIDKFYVKDPNLSKELNQLWTPIGMSLGENVAYVPRGTNRFQIEPLSGS